MKVMIRRTISFGFFYEDLKKDDFKIFFLKSSMI